jgi:trigger factor
MKVTETKNEGLKREYNVVLPAKNISKEVEHRLAHVAQTIKMPGFRPGKVPLGMVKKKHGRAVLGEVLENVVSKTTQQVLSEKNVIPALQPKITIESAFDEGTDLKYSLSFEVYPEVPDLDFSKVSLKRAHVEVADKDIDDGLERLQKAQREFEPLKKARPAKSGDSVLINFKGKVDGVAFEGGSAENFRLELGSGQFIPGYEDQLIGAKKGEDLVVKVTFPENYGSANLAGKESEFDVHVIDILAPTLPEVNDAFATKLGYENVEKLREAVKQQIEKDFAGLAHTKLKKELFDALEKLVKFDVPEGMLELEYKALAENVGIAAEGGSKDDKKKQKEYHDLALRRVRLGILLADVGKKNNVTISADELRRAVFEQARAYPGQEQRVIELYQNNPQALDQLKGPILEDKVVNFLLEKAKISEQKSTVKELLAFHESQGD